jgi:hypothetical protein
VNGFDVVAALSQNPTRLAFHSRGTVRWLHRQALAYGDFLATISAQLITPLS